MSIIFEVLADRRLHGRLDVGDLRFSVSSMRVPVLGADVEDLEGYAGVDLGEELPAKLVAEPRDDDDEHDAWPPPTIQSRRLISAVSKRV